MSLGHPGLLGSGGEERGYENRLRVSGPNDAAVAGGDPGVTATRRSTISRGINNMHWSRELGGGCGSNAVFGSSIVEGRAQKRGEEEKSRDSVGL
jgi:hypothetical protein